MKVLRWVYHFGLFRMAAALAALWAVAWWMQNTAASWAAGWPTGDPGRVEVWLGAFAWWLVDAGFVATSQEVVLFLVLWAIAILVLDAVVLPHIDLRGLIMGEGVEADIPVSIRASSIKGWLFVCGMIGPSLALILYS